MARFNQNNIRSYGYDTVNLAGGVAYEQPAEEAFAHLLLTSFFQDQYYRSKAETENTLRELMSKIDDKLFLAQAAVYVRTQFGMRSVSHFVGAELAKDLSGKPWAKAFYDKVVYRVDDMTEILSCYLGQSDLKKDVRVPNAMKKGFAKAFDRFDAYQLAKYRMEGKKIRLVDLVNLVHPKPTEKNREALQQLVRDTLRNTATWEAMLSEAGQNRSGEEDSLAMQSKAWEQLVTTRKIGYLALLRNIRNIWEKSPHVAPAAVEMLTDRQLLKKSLVTPFQFKVAFEAMEHVNYCSEIYFRSICRRPGTWSDFENHQDVAIKILNEALDTALEMSLDNVPKLEGRTAVVLDVSDSMSGRPAQIGSLFAAVMAKTNGCDLMTFSHDAQYVPYDPTLPVRTIAESIVFTSGGTNFSSIFEKMDKPYDCIVLLSDMQAWGSRFCPAKVFAEYRKRFACDPLVFCWDLQGYGSNQFIGSRIVPVTGFSDRAFDFMKDAEGGYSKIVEKIRAIELE